MHQDWGESDPPTFDRNIVAQVVQNEMIAAILGKDLVIDPANPPARPAGRGFTLVGPIAPEGTRGNSSEGVDVWGPGTAPPSSRRPAGRRSGQRAKVDRPRQDSTQLDAPDGLVEVPALIQRRGPAGLRRPATHAGKSGSGSRSARDHRESSC